MGQTEGTQLVSSRTVEHISSQVEKKTMPEKELSATSYVKKKCFACHDTSHNLEQCKAKYKHATRAHQFGYATKYPFTVIQPSEETEQKEKLYHHCGSLDLAEDWLLVSGIPRIHRNWMDLYHVASAFGVLIDVDEESLEVADKEPIRLKIASRSFDGAPFSYYSAFGWSSKLVMLTAVQDKTEDNEHNKELNAAKCILLEEAKGIEDSSAAKSILLEEAKGIAESRSSGEAKKNKVSAPEGPSSCHLSQKISASAATITNFEKTTTESSKPEGVRSICPSQRIMIGEQHLRGIQKPPIKHVYERRNKKQQVTEAINKSPSNKMDKEVAPHSNNNVTRTEASTGCDMLEKDCSKIVPQRELNMKEIAPVRESKKAKKLGACRDNVAAPSINLKKTQILGDTSRTPRDELITKHTKGVWMDKMGTAVQVQKREDASKKVTRLLPSSEEVGIYESFGEMGLQENLLKGIYQYGLEKPSAVHKRGIVPLCKGFGVVHQSFSGTTETICTGVLQRLDYGSAECQALIVVPTPDLAQETKKVIGALGQFLGVTAQTCTGGTSAHADQQTLSSRVQVLIGTPECILDMLQWHGLSPDHIRMLFLDEADELLTGASKDQINKITMHLKKKIQVGLFSATYSNNEAIHSLRFMNKPVEVTVPREEELMNVKQYYLEVDNEELKLGKLYALIKATGVERLGIVIFVNTKNKARLLAKDISKHYAVSISHDGMNQNARKKAMQNLNSGSCNILISTDHRDYAMPQVSMIINYDVPTESMQYVRRLQQQNREFRKPQSVVAITLVTPADRRTLAPITKFCNSSIGELPSNMKW